MIRMTSQQISAKTPQVVLKEVPPADPMSIELAFWRSINQRSADELRLYLATYPEGHFTQLAKIRVAKVDSEMAQTLTVERIMDLVAEKSGVSVLGMKSPRRSRRYAYARFVAMELCREFTALTQPQITRHFGRRDHSMVIHAGKVLRDMRLLKNKPDYVRDFLALYEDCKVILLNEGRIVA